MLEKIFNFIFSLLGVFFSFIVIDFAVQTFFNKSTTLPFFLTVVLPLGIIAIFIISVFWQNYKTFFS